MTSPAIAVTPQLVPPADLDRLLPEISALLTQRLAGSSGNGQREAASVLAEYRAADSIFVALRLRGELVGFACGCAVDRAGLFRKLDQQFDLHSTDFYLGENGLASGSEQRGHEVQLLRSLLVEAEKAGFMRVVAVLRADQESTQKIARELNLTFVSDARVTFDGQESRVGVYCRSFKA